MRARGIRPTLNAWCTLIAMYGRSRGPLAAQQVYQQMIKASGTADEFSLRAVLFSHAGSRGLLRAFEPQIIDDSTKYLGRPTIQMISSMINCYNHHRFWNDAERLLSGVLDGSLGVKPDGRALVSRSMLPAGIQSQSGPLPKCGRLS